MIINTTNSSLEISGDIKNYKTSIDPKNMDFITTILSSNLYSKPVQSFVRETVSNAWDSQVEAGNTDTPILIKIDTDKLYNPKFVISIRDFGTGISPERFETVYCNIGSSTKRDSNEFIGCFGLGRFSVMAVSKSAFITSYYEGKAYNYVMTKDGNSINISLVNIADTTEHNGVLVKVSGQGSNNDLYAALENITFFPNIYIDTNFAGLEFNKIKIKRFKNFSVSTLLHNNHLLLGNVLYSLNKHMLDSSSRAIYDKIESTGIVINFDIGELEVTPNREEIIYNTATKNFIQDRIQAAYKEIIELVDSGIPTDTQDLLLWNNMIAGAIKYDFFSNKIVSTSRNNRHDKQTTALIIDFAELSKSVPLYKGRSITDYKEVINGLLLLQFPEIRCIVKPSSYIATDTNKISWDLKRNARMKSSYVRWIDSSIKLIAPIKDYIREYYRNYNFIEKIPYEDFVHYCLDGVKYNLKGTISKAIVDPNIQFILKDLYNIIYAPERQFDPNTDTNYLEFKVLRDQKMKENRELNKVNLQNIILYYYEPINNNKSTVKTKKYFKDSVAAVSFIKRIKNGVVLSSIENDFNAPLVTAMGYIFITAASKTYKALLTYKYTNVINIKFLETSPKIKKLKALLNNNFVCNFDYIAVKTFPTALQKQLYELRDLYNKYVNNCALIYYIENTDWLEEDADTKKVCEEYKKHLRLYDSVAGDLLAHCEYTIPNVLKTYLIMKNKLYRINYESYYEIKNDHLIKLLCPK